MLKMNHDAAQMFELFELTPDLVCIAGRDGFFKRVNPAVIQKLGYSMEELLSKPIFSFMHPDDRERTGMEREKMFKGSMLLNFQNRYCSKKGEVIWLEWTSIFIPDKEIVFAIAKDITAGKKAAHEIEDQYRKSKELTNHFKSSMEKDRRSLATELHEQLAQLATVIRLDLSLIENEAGTRNEIMTGRIKHAMETSDLLIDTLRRLSFSISPNMLDEMGLNEVMRWFCRESSKLNTVTCDYKSTVSDDVLTEEIQVDIFRICQQRVAQIVGHGTATRIAISLEQQKSNLLLSITDDGQLKDIQLDDLPGIRERVASINGSVEVERKAGRETQLRVYVALTSGAGSKGRGQKTKVKS